MRAAILHFCDPAVRISGAFPLLVGDLLVFAPAIQPAQVFSSSVGCSIPSAFFGQPPQVLFPILPPLSLRTMLLIAALAFQRRGVNRHGLAPQQALLFQQELLNTKTNTLSNTDSGNRCRISTVINTDAPAWPSVSRIPRNDRKARLSAHRQAMPRRWPSKPSKSGRSGALRKSTPSGMPGRPPSL